MEISKKKLLSLLNKNLTEMAMEFDSEDRPSNDVINQISNQDTPHKQIPYPKGNQTSNFQEILASERYKRVLENVRRYVGVEGPFKGINNATMGLMQATMASHNKIINLERNYKSQLEQLAIDLVLSEFGIDPNNIIIDAKIVLMSEIDMSEFNLTPNNENSPEVDIDSQEVEMELLQDFENLDIEKAKRRLINAVIQGASKKGHYMFQLVSDKLRELTGSDELLNNYGILMAANDMNYWQLDDSYIEQGVKTPAGMSKSSKDNEDDEEGESKQKVIARAINFPALIHEIIKGIYETVGQHGLPTDPDLANKVIESEDTIFKEIWDLRLGPSIWERIRNQFPDEIIDENKKTIQLHLLMTIFRLPAKEFLVFMREVVSGSQNGKNLMKTLFTSLEERLNNEEYEDTLNEFNDDLEVLTNNSNDNQLSDELNDLLSDLNIKFGNDDDDDDDDENDDEFLNRFR
jgi:hypothetical protein